MRALLKSSRVPVQVVLLLVLLAGAAHAQAPVDYRLSFADAAHHVMQVEVTFPDVTADPLQVRMSRSSPGRYAAHDFAKNVFDVKVTDGKGRPLTAARPNPHQWDIGGHGGTVRISYRIYGHHVDGTYLAVDASHAHMNVPATLMWARGLDMRGARVTLTPPPATVTNGAVWKVATQLYPTSDPLAFTAPNLQYLMDSPIEFSDQTIRSFTVPQRNVPQRNAPQRSGPQGNEPQGTGGGTGDAMATIRVAIHHTGTDAEVDAFVQDVEKIVREQTAIIGELPAFEPGYYTFLNDYLPWGGGDAMEHRNSTVCASTATLAANHTGLLGAVSHEFFHLWNVERIRPKTLEPFSFEDANISGELWLAEGFTNYYGKLALLRAGLRDGVDGVVGWAGVINGVMNSPGTKMRSAVEMSRLAPFVDAAVSIDSTYWPNTFYSYYPFGEVIALGLDLTLRDKTDGRVTLDDYMRAMWTAHGKPGGPAPGLVGQPYTLADARARLAEVTGDKAFADDFFTRYIEGTERIDYARLLEKAGFVLRPYAAASASGGGPAAGGPSASGAVAGAPSAGAASANRPAAGAAAAPAAGTAPAGAASNAASASAPAAATPAARKASLGLPRGELREDRYRLIGPAMVGSAAYAAGLDLGDEIVTINDTKVTGPGDVDKAIAGRRPGDDLAIVYVRYGRERRATAKLIEDARLEIVPVEKIDGRTLSDAQKRFRAAWLSSKVATAAAAGAAGK